MRQWLGDVAHNCTPSYCLQDPCSCRFFSPWPRQPQQQYDENTDRVALERPLPEDDQWVNPHNLPLAMFSPSTVHFAPFDPETGAFDVDDTAPSGSVYTTSRTASAKPCMISAA